jgi:type VI secretion system secreted protein VgrG
MTKKIIIISYNDPNRPFVMGSLFNGKIGAGGQAQNNIKSIYTRTGSTITFDEGASSILVKDPSGNSWFMDGAGNIEVTAPNDITFNAGKNLNINVGENMSTNVGMNKTDFIAMNQTENVGMIKTTAVSGDANMFITGKLLEMIEGDVHSETQNGKTIVNSSEGIESSASGVISYNAQKKIENNGGEKSNNY